MQNTCIYMLVISYFIHHLCWTSSKRNKKKAKCRKHNSYKSANKFHLWAVFWALHGMCRKNSYKSAGRFLTAVKHLTTVFTFVVESMWTRAENFPALVQSAGKFCCRNVEESFLRKLSSTFLQQNFPAHWTSAEKFPGHVHIDSTTKVKTVVRFFTAVRNLPALL